MISAFRVRPVASGRGLCVIDSVLFRVTQSRVKNWEILEDENIPMTLVSQFEL